jgi:hypothetical protein
VPATWLAGSVALRFSSGSRTNIRLLACLLKEVTSFVEEGFEAGLGPWRGRGRGVRARGQIHSLHDEYGVWCAAVWAFRGNRAPPKRSHCDLRAVKLGECEAFKGLIERPTLIPQDANGHCFAKEQRLQRI